MKFTKEVRKDWEKNFQKLLEFKEEKGHCDVPPGYHDTQLYNWTKIQIKLKNTLPSQFKKKLIAIDFDFSDNKYPWDDKFKELKDFAKKFGHVHVPATDPAYENLHTWLIQQIKNKKFLSENRKKQLDYLGIYWEFKSLRDWKWQEMYMRLEKYFEKYGDSRVPQKWEKDPKLSNWVLVQRRQFGEGKMNVERRKKLERLNFVWDFRDVYEDQWEEKYQMLKDFKKEHGHCKVPLAHKNQRLAGWVDRQRTLKSKGKLSKERTEKLDKIDFIWDCTILQEQLWEKRFQELLEYKKKHGNCLVPVNYKKNRKLGIWVSTQRTIDKHGKLDSDKKKRLKEVGFIWKNQTKEYQDKKYNQIWEKNFQKLVEYKKKYGKIQVSVKRDRPLQRWTCAQRKAYQLNKLSKERFRKLDQIGFPWDIHEAYWNMRYRQLIDFKRRFGHTRVPWGWEENSKLGQWVSRTRLGKNELTKSQIKKLDAIGFDWKVMKKTMTPWMVMYEHLIEFKKSFGHTRVPVNWEHNRKLGKWISRIRSEQHKLKPERKRLLEKIDFDWKKRRGRLKRERFMMENV